MKSNFWKKLKKPIIVLAPMSGVTDAVFRQMLLKLGRPDVFWTEFIPTDGLFSKGREKILEDLKFLSKEHPIVVQIFGSKPELFKETAKMVAKLGFDGIDINMGCPNRDIEKTGACAALIKNPKLAKEIIRATKQGAGKIPVSVKTRIGYSKNEIEKWIPAILKENIAALTVHFRTRSELFRVPAHWEFAKQIVKLRDHYSPETLIFGNGDVKSLAQARKLVKETGLDGVMIGREVLANPWLFSERTPGLKERINTTLEHAKIFEKVHKNKRLKNGDIKNYNSIKKYFKAYATGFVGAKDFRESLMKTQNMIELRKIIKKFLKQKLI